MASRPSNRFRLLTGGNRTALPRQQTLRAVVAWSWDLLTESESTLMERLSVFRGGATAITAEAVCAADRPELAVTLPADDVPDLLISLADRSLLVIVDRPAEPDDETADDVDRSKPRYRMLETIREYAAEQLAERGEQLVLRRAHAAYFLDLAERAEPELRGHDRVRWIEQLTAERDNLLATLRFAVETSDAAGATRLVAALSWYWTLLGRHDEAAAWLGPALSIPGERPVQAYAIARLMHTISATSAGLGRPDDAEIDDLSA